MPAIDDDCAINEMDVTRLCFYIVRYIYACCWFDRFMTALIYNPKGTDITPSVYSCALLRVYSQPILGQFEDLEACNSRCIDTMPLSRCAGIDWKAIEDRNPMETIKPFC